MIIVDDYYSKLAVDSILYTGGFRHVDFLFSTVPGEPPLAMGNLRCAVEFCCSPKFAAMVSVLGAVPGCPWPPRKTAVGNGDDVGTLCHQALYPPRISLIYRGVLVRYSFWAQNGYLVVPDAWPGGPVVVTIPLTCC